MEKFEQIKKNHHYVWSYYLKSWADQKNEIFYISQKGKVAKDSVKGLAKDIDFYKMNSLNEEDVNFIKGLSSVSTKDLQDIHLKQLNYFQKLLNIEKLKLNPLYSDEQSKLVQIVKSNTLENTYSIIEKFALYVISELIKGNSKILENKSNLIFFLYYIGHQFTRTKAFKEKCLAALKEDGRLYLLWEKNWWFISYMFGINLGNSFYKTRMVDKHIFIINNTHVPFITSDSPVINIHPSLDKLEKGKAPEYLYFPLSPKYAYMINNSDTYNELENIVQDDDVIMLNEYIYKESYKTVFANSDEMLSLLRK